MAKDISKDTKKSADAASQDGTFIDKSLSFGLSEAILAKIQTQVSFANEAQVHTFIADAINTYIQLGNLHVSGAKFTVEDKDGATAMLRFPFDEVAKKAAADAQGEVSGTA